MDAITFGGGKVYIEGPNVAAICANAAQLKSLEARLLSRREAAEHAKLEAEQLAEIKRGGRALAAAAAPVPDKNVALTAALTEAMAQAQALDVRAADRSLFVRSFLAISGRSATDAQIAACCADLK